MKSKISLPDLECWLTKSGIEVKERRRVSCLCTNFYLNDGGVLCIYDSGTVVMQGNPPVQVVDLFNRLRELKALQDNTPVSTEELDEFDSIINSTRSEIPGALDGLEDLDFNEGTSEALTIFPTTDKSVSSKFITRPDTGSEW